MAKQNKTRYIDLNVKQEGFVSKFLGSSFRSQKENQDKQDFSDISLLRKLLTNEKARILCLLKTKKPSSIYALAKMLGRDFKSVSTDVKLLEKFGFIEFHSIKKGKRSSLMPVLSVSQMNIVVNV